MKEEIYMTDLPEKFKIMVPDKFSEEIQRKLFSLGKCWNGGDTDIIDYNNIKFIVVTNENFTCGAGEVTKIDEFVKLDIPEITFTQLMNAKPRTDPKKCIVDLGDSLISLYKSIKKIEDGFENIFYK